MHRALRRTMAVLGMLAVLPAGNAFALIAMRVSNISDFNLAGWNIGDPAVNASMDICIYTSGLIPPGSYAVTVSSNTGAYTLVNGAKQIPYSLYWEDAGAGNLGSGAGTQLSNGVKLTGQLRGNLLNSNCALTGPNARLNLNITQAAMTAALAGTYTGTITLFLTPN